MGYAISYQVKCDQCNDTTIADVSRKLARDTARRSGWIRRRKGKHIIDICDRCAPKWTTFEGGPMNYIRHYYKVPARRGGLVKFEGQYGRIIGTSGPHLRVRFRDLDATKVLHPKESGLEYLTDDDLPTLTSLQGIAPNATGGLSSEEFVRNLRDEWEEK